MKYTVTLPADFSEPVTVLAWHKSLGEAVYAGDALATMQGRDRDEVIVNSPAFGVLHRRCVTTGEAIEAGEPLVVLAGVTHPPVPPPVVAEAYEEGYPLARHHAAALSAPQIITVVEPNWSEVDRLAEKIGASRFVFVVAAVAAQLPRFPVFNAECGVHGSVFVRPDVHIGVNSAVGTRVLREAQKKSVLQIARELPTLTEMRGATMTMTEATELVYQTPVLHLPQTAHLVVTARSLILAHDARVADEFLSANFLQAIAAHINNSEFLFV